MPAGHGAGAEGEEQETRLLMGESDALRVSGGKSRTRSSNTVCLHAAADQHMLHLLSEEGQLIQEESMFSISTRAPQGRRL